MLQIKNVSIRLAKNLRPILEGFNFSLGPGDKAAIIGEEGNGKSTLIKLIANPDADLGYAQYEGSIFYGDSIPGYLPQEMPKGDLALTVHDYWSQYADGAHPGDAAAVLSKLGLPASMADSPQSIDTLSGGEKVKLQLARVLLASPDFLLLDEPTNDIDIDTLAWLEDFINTCALPVLYVSHDEKLLENTANRIIHMEQVRRKTVARHTIVSMGYEEYVNNRLDGLRRQEKLAAKDRQEYQKSYDRWQRVYERVDHEQRVISRQDPGGARLLKKKMHTVKAQEGKLERKKENMTDFPDYEEPIMPAFDEGVAIPNGKTVLDLSMPQLTAGGRRLCVEVLLRVTGPEHVCIVGKNGAGKTTLLRLIAEEMLSRRDLKAAYMPQNYKDLLDQSVKPAQFLVPGGRKEDITRARTYLGSMKYTADEMEHSVCELSGGQKAKLLFIKMVLDGCNVLILDEPTRNFSPLSGPVIREMLKGFPGAMISVSHDRKFIAQVCDKVYVLDEGGLVQSTRDAFGECE